MDFNRQIQLILDNPANNLTDSAIDMLETMQILLEAQSKPENFNILNNSVCFPADLDEPFPTIDVLTKLTEASEILLHEKDYDGHGWEIIAKCVERAKEIKEKYYK